MGQFEAACDFPYREPLGKELEDLPLGRSQPAVKQSEYLTGANQPHRFAKAVLFAGRVLVSQLPGQKPSAMAWGIDTPSVAQVVAQKEVATLQIPTAGLPRIFLFPQPKMNECLLRQILEQSLVTRQLESNFAQRFPCF